MTHSPKKPKVTDRRRHIREVKAGPTTVRQHRMKYMGVNQRTGKSALESVNGLEEKFDIVGPKKKNQQKPIQFRDIEDITLERHGIRLEKTSQAWGRVDDKKKYYNSDIFNPKGKKYDKSAVVGGLVGTGKDSEGVVFITDDGFAYGVDLKFVNDSFFDATGYRVLNRQGTDYLKSTPRVVTSTFNNLRLKYYREGGAQGIWASSTFRLEIGNKLYVIAPRIQQWRTPPPDLKKKK